MSLTLVHSQEAEGLHTSCFIPVFRDGYGNPDFSRAKTYINSCIRNADIDRYGVYDRQDGFTVALPGNNALVRFMYFFEGNHKQESELLFKAETEEQTANILDWLSELTEHLGIEKETQLYVQDDTLHLRFDTREANVKTHFQIKHEFEEERKLIAQGARNTPSPT